MTETPAHPPSTHTLTSGRKLGWRTPYTSAHQKTPRVHRLLASAGPKTPHGKSEAYQYEGLLGKTWRIHTLSPLFKFAMTPVALKRYGRSLDVAFSKGNSVEGLIGSEQERTRSWFEIYHGLSFHAADPDAIRIQVTEKHDNVEKVVLTAILACVDMGEVPVLEDKTTADYFTFYPVLLVCGTKPRAQVLLDWLQCHFDCRSSPMEFSDSDLRWMLALGCQRQGVVKPHPILLQYDVRDICDGINTIDCKFESHFCKDLWDNLQAESASQEFLTQSQVSQFLAALEVHLEYTMHILFKKLTLSEVGTPLVYVSKDGKMKMFDSKGIYVCLHLICDVITEKFLQGYGSSWERSAVP